LRAQLQVLSQADQAQVHERTLSLLMKTGVRVETARGRRILGLAGAMVDENRRVVRFPRALVEESLSSAPRVFSLGGRRPELNLPMNAGNCFLLADGGAFWVYDAEAGERRPAERADRIKSTRLIDALDEISLYWWMVREDFASNNMGDFVAYWRDVFTHTSKHVQDSTNNPAQSRWLSEILQVVFGAQDIVQQLHPLSFLLSPPSPLTIDETFTDAYLEITGWNIPVAMMPMPLMGTTSPGNLISTIVLGNCEVLAMLCLVQAAAPGTPVIYAPALSVADPRSGRFGSGAIEQALLGAAVTEMARYYRLPAEASTGGTDHHIPGIQASYERALNWMLPTLSWPDILVGPGLLSGSTVLSYEQLLIDIEIFQRCRRIYQGIDCDEGKWLDEVIAKVGPGGNYLAQRSTRDAVRSAEWYTPRLGVHEGFDHWDAAGRPDLLVEIRQKIDQVLAHHQPLPLDENQMRELAHIEQKARLQETT